MSNKLKDRHKKLHKMLFDDIIDTKNFDPNKFKIDEKSYKNIFIYYIRCVTVKDSK